MYHRAVLKVKFYCNYLCSAMDCGIRLFPQGPMSSITMTTRLSVDTRPPPWIRRTPSPRCDDEAGDEHAPAPPSCALLQVESNTPEQQPVFPGIRETTALNCGQVVLWVCWRHVRVQGTLHNKASEVSSWDQNGDVTLQLWWFYLWGDAVLLICLINNFYVRKFLSQTLFQHHSTSLFTLYYNFQVMKLPDLEGVA